MGLLVVLETQRGRRERVGLTHARTHARKKERSKRKITKGKLNPETQTE